MGHGHGHEYGRPVAAADAVIGAAGAAGAVAAAAAAGTDGVLLRCSYSTWPETRAPVCTLA